jgi:FkbM family methyltransferase
MSITLNPSKGIIHIGASTGQEAHQYYQRHLNVLWIEANPSIYQRLIQNISRYENQIALNCLLTDVNDKQYEFHVSNNNGESSSIFELHHHKEIWPDVTYSSKLHLNSKTLSTLLHEENIDLDKYDGLILDTQGSELLILQGGVDILNNITYVKTEVADFESYKDCCQLTEMDDFFTHHGFKRTALIQFAESRYGNYYDAIYEKDVGQSQPA